MRDRKEPTRRVVVTVVMECDVWDQLPYWAAATDGNYAVMTDDDIQRVMERRMAEFAAGFDTMGQGVRTRDVRLVTVERA